MDGWMDEWMDGWMDGWMAGWMDGWMAGWMDGFIYVVITKSRHILHICSLVIIRIKKDYKRLKNPIECNPKNKYLL